MEATKSTETLAHNLDDGATVSATSSNSVSRRNSQEFVDEQADLEREPEEQAKMALGKDDADEEKKEK